ncbi:MAG: hypothetical protein GF353_19505 [Candidatus Lokiarchaeota archaeon]|nr:hypothetical protein [Candidatus Lokiarchaeota archaeon]
MNFKLSIFLLLYLRPRITSLTDDEIHATVEESLSNEFSFYGQEYINDALYSLGILK